MGTRKDKIDLSSYELDKMHKWRYIFNITLEKNGDDKIFKTKKLFSSLFCCHIINH
jgi:hypothetical protein